MGRSAGPQLEHAWPEFIKGLEMNTDSGIYVPAPAVRLMKSRVLSRPGVNSVPADQLTAAVNSSGLELGFTSLEAAGEITNEPTIGWSRKVYTNLVHLVSSPLEGML